MSAADLIAMGVERAHARELRRLGRAVRDGSILPRWAHYYDGRATHAWSIIDGVVWRHERGPDGQRFADRRIGKATREIAAGVVS